MWYEGMETERAKRGGKRGVAGEEVAGGEEADRDRADQSAVGRGGTGESEGRVLSVMRTGLESLRVSCCLLDEEGKLVREGEKPGSWRRDRAGNVSSHLYFSPSREKEERLTSSWRSDRSRASALEVDSRTKSRRSCRRSSWSSPLLASGLVAICIAQRGDDGGRVGESNGDTSGQFRAVPPSPCFPPTFISSLV